MVAASAFCLAAAVACGSLPQGPAASSPSGDAALNVRGTVDRAYTPTCPTDEPCDPPMTAVFVVFSQPGSADVRAGVDGRGAFAVHLDSGIWSISAAPPPMGGRVEPSEVRVPATGTVDLHLRIVRTPAQTAIPARVLTAGHGF